MSKLLIKGMFFILIIFIYVYSLFNYELSNLLLCYGAIYLIINIFLLIVFKGISIFNGFQVIIFFNFIYTFLYPFLSYIGKVNNEVFVVKKEVLENYLSYNIQAIFIFSLLSIFFAKNIDKNKLNESLKKEYKKFKSNKIVLNFLMIFIIVKLCETFPYLKLGREKYLNMLNQNVFFHYLTWAIILFILIDIYMNYTRNKIIYIAILIIYILIVLSIGNRREVSYIIIGFLSYYFFKRAKITLKFYQIIILFLIFFGMLGWSLYRDQNRIISIEHNYINTYGEFLIPAQVSFDLLEQGNEKINFGKTYLMWPGYIIPRKIYQNKPISLSEDYYSKYKKQSGLGGFTPFSEAYINFGIFSGVYLGVYLFFIAKFLTNYLIYKNFLLFVIFFMQVMNFMRGETGTSLVEILMFYIFIKSLLYIKKISTRN
ncbi:O-antigen polymerase [Cetobacterium sp.]|uniref:O-antigen polymerase n=1 Tax=Cetobacterium sp. TaxID=2071632 RepID=UPI003EE71551